MISNNSQSQETGFWTCDGKEKNQPHPLRMVNYGDECPDCHHKEKVKRKSPPPPPPPPSPPPPPPPPPPEDVNSPEPTSPQVPPKRDIDWPLVGALTILNVGSGFTTVRGALQILPNFVAYPMGVTIQGILFALVSRSFLKHAPLIKWVVVGCFSTFSVYTSFFAYYDLLTGDTREKDRIERANSAHKSLVGEVFTPIQNKVNSLESEINIKETRIQDEIKGIRGRPAGCGAACLTLKEEKEILEGQKDRVEPLANRLKPLFQYNLTDKSPEEIFDADLKALSEVGENCLPKELLSQLNITCLPDKYLRALNPQNPEYRELSSTYIDPDLEVDFVAPILKVSKGEGSAIAAAIMALLIDGCIILLGIGVEIRPRVTRQKRETLTLRLKDGNILEFLDLLLSQNETIEIKENDENKDEYQSLLSWFSANTQWIWQDGEDKSWGFQDYSTKEKFRKWLVNERNRQIKADTNLLKFWKKKSQEYFELEMPIVAKDKD